MHETQVFSFGPFVLDLRDRLLLRGDELIPLAPKEFELLQILVGRAGHLVRKEELIRRVWADTFVTESSLLRNISVLRKHLGHDSIRTMPKCGYAFVLPVVAHETQEEMASSAKRAATGTSSFERSAIVAEDREGENFETHEREGRSALLAKVFLWSRQPFAEIRGRWIPSYAGTLLALAIASLIMALSVGALIRTSPPSAPMQASGSSKAMTADADSRASLLFVLNQGGKSISMLPTADPMGIRTLSLEADPRGAAILPDRSVEYISLNGADRVVALNPRTNEIIATIPVGKNPVGVAANPRPPYVYVANNYSNSVSVIDARTNTVVRTLAVGGVPTEIAVTADGNRAIVTNQSSGTVTMIDSRANQVIATIPVGSTPVGVAFTPDSKLAWVTLAGENKVAVIDVRAKAVVNYVGVGLGPVRVIITNSGQYALVSNFFSNTLSVVDTEAMRSIGTIQVGLNPVGVALDSAGVVGYAANFGSNSISVIDMTSMKLVSTIDVGSNPVEMTMLPCYAVPCGSPLARNDASLFKN